MKKKIKMNLSTVSDLQTRDVGAKVIKIEKKREEKFKGGSGIMYK